METRTVINAIVEASTFYGAVAKGSAAMNLLVKVDSAVDDCQLIYDFDEKPAA